jgi:hypothetical protein
MGTSRTSFTSSGVPDYFDDLLERIHDIRASEKRTYLRVREIFSLAGDYDSGRRETMEFFQIIQNRLHFAATGKTAPELIAGSAAHAKPNMGLIAWKGGPGPRGVSRVWQQASPVRRCGYRGSCRL